MTIVPLNFEAPPLFARPKPQLLQLVAVSSFFVPQFGQNKVASYR